MQDNSWSVRLADALRDEQITADDFDLITKYLEYKIIHDSIKPKRRVKIVQHLINYAYKWSKTEYKDMTVEIWVQSASKIISSRYAQNTKADYITVVKGFLYWGVQKKHLLHMTREDIREVRTPKQQIVTKSPEDLLNDQDVYSMLLHPATDPMMGALVSILYWTGARIGEALSLRWKDITFGNMMLGIRINDTKSGIQRYAPCCEALEFVSVWRSRYPEIRGGPNGDNYVFITLKKDIGWQQMSVPNAEKRIRTIGNSVLGRHIHPHLFRASDITNSAAKGVSDAANKEIHWGNQGTTRLKTYLLLNNSQIEEAMYARAGIEHKKTEEEKRGPIQCKYCRAVNVPGSSYCRMCGMPLTQTAQDSQTTISEAVSYVQQHYSMEDMIESMSSVLGITQDKARQILMGGM